MSNTIRRIAPLALALCLPAAAFAQQEGLVNVKVDNNVVQVPIGIAAQVCDVDANVLAQDFAGTEDTACTIDQQTAADAGIGDGPGKGKGGGNGKQNGLVNVSVADNVVQVPVSVAAQVCDVEVNALARDFAGSDDTACSVDQETAAEAGILN